MPDIPTIGDLYKAKLITDDELRAAVEAYFADPTEDAYPIAEGYDLDLAAAVQGHEPARKTLEHPDRTDKFKQTMVRTALIAARPEKR